MGLANLSPNACANRPTRSAKFSTSFCSTIIIQQPQHGGEIADVRDEETPNSQYVMHRSFGEAIQDKIGPNCDVGNGTGRTYGDSAAGASPAPIELARFLLTGAVD